MTGWRSGLAGRVVLVTGAGKGLGRAYARWLAGAGAAVVVNNRSAPDGTSTAELVAAEIRRAGGTAVADDHSVGDADGCRAMVEKAEATFGRLDALVCNAGMSRPFDVDAIDVDDFRAVLEVNFWGSVLPVVAALPGMLARGSGRVVLTTSSAGFFGDAGQAPYAAAKSAVLGFARSLGIDTRERGVRVNLIAPSAATTMSAGFDISAQDRARMAPDHVAPVVGWLCSDACTSSGLVLHAGSGRVRRIQVLGGRAVDIPDGDVAACWPALDDLTAAFEASISIESGAVLRAGPADRPAGQ